MIHLFRNLRLAVGMVVEHLSDDPFLLLLQLSRRLPAWVTQPIAGTIGLIARSKSAAVPVLLAAMLRGDGVDLERRLNFGLKRHPGGTRAARFAEIALASNLPVVADHLLAEAVDSLLIRSALSRRHCYDGELTAGLAALDGPGPLLEKQRLRLIAETAVLHHWVPFLERRPYEPKPGRVLHLLTNSLPHTASGYAQRSHSMLRAQRDAGWEVLAVTRIGYPVLVGKLFAESRDTVDGITYQRLLPSKLGATADVRLQQQAEELLSVALEFEPSILHTTTHYVNGLVVRAVAEALGIPWVYEVRGQLADTWASTRGPDARESEKYRQFQIREAEVMQSANLVVTLGEAMRDNIVAAGVSVGKILIAPNAVGGDYLEEPADVMAARRDLGLPELGKYIGTVSSLVPYEGIDDLIAAFELLAPVHPELRLLIVGDGTSMPALRQQARRSDFHQRIIFTGRVPRSKARMYHQALDVFVVPRRESEVTRSVTPLKPVEALACARPVVASKLPALEEIVSDGISGLFANAGDRQEISIKLETLLRSEELRTRYGQAGRQRVLKSRTWTANAQSLADAYEGLMEARR